LNGDQVGRKEHRVVDAAEREIAIERWREGCGISELARELGVHRNTVNQWIRGKDRYRIASQEGERDPQALKIEELQQQIAALEGTVGRQAMEIRFFKGALRRVEGSRQQKKESGGTASTPKSGA
jgi:transposase-like protein